MKLGAYLLITICLVVGVVGALTAYLPRLDLPDERLIGLTLNDVAGKRHAADGGGPIASKNDTITAALLAELRAAGVGRVRVKEFGFDRWSGWWMFLLGCLGLGGGAVVVKREIRREIAASGQARAEGGAGPEESLSSVLREVAALRQRLGTLPDEQARLRAIIETLGAAQQGGIASFVAARPVLLGRLGMSGFARLMDAFSAAERQVNRAWSAAADGVEAEATACLERAETLLGEAGARLSSAASR